MLDFLSQTTAATEGGAPWWASGAPWWVVVPLGVVPWLAPRLTVFGKWVLALIAARGEAAADVEKARSGAVPGIVEGWHEAVEEARRSRDECERRTAAIEARAVAAEQECNERTRRLEERVGRLEGKAA
jgi:hypothetical protein